jgi:uncharacterized membrane protein
MSLLAGSFGYLVARLFESNYFVAGAVIAAVISMSVSWMLSMLFNMPMLATLPYLFISEQMVCFIGAFIFKLIETRFRWW